MIKLFVKQRTETRICRKSQGGLWKQLPSHLWQPEQEENRIHSSAVLSLLRISHGFASDILIGPSERLQTMSKLILPSNRLVWPVLLCYSKTWSLILVAVYFKAQWIIFQYLYYYHGRNWVPVYETEQKGRVWAHSLPTVKRRLAEAVEGCREEDKGKWKRWDKPVKLPGSPLILEASTRMSKCM